MVKIIKSVSRRGFLKASGVLAGAGLLGAFSPDAALAGNILKKKVPVNAHLWVYASKFPPNWDSTPVLDQVFSDLSYAGYDGVELMEVNLRNEAAVAKLKEVSDKYQLGVSGTSYYAEMWDGDRQQEILEDVEMVVERLHQVGGKTMGITVGTPDDRMKTEKELDAQAELLKKILPLCRKHHIEPNLHNHTYEVENDLHDLKGTLSRIPDIKLGPDLNWLIRGGVDPVWFINTYGDRIVYLHIRDQQADGEWTEAVGEGVTDFKAIAKALKKNNFQGMAAVELAFPDDLQPSRPLKESWKISREYVRKTFGW